MVTSQFTRVVDLEAALRGAGVRLNQVPDDPKDQEITTADGRFRVSAARVQNRIENRITMYNVLTGEPLSVDVNRVPMMLKKKFPNTPEMQATAPEKVGQFAFTMGVHNVETGQWGPPKPWKVGALYCLLHPLHPDVDYIRSLGVDSVCSYHRIPNVVQQRAHMRSKHPGEMALLEQDKSDRIRREETARMDALVRLATQGTLTNTLQPQQESAPTEIPVPVAVPRGDSAKPRSHRAKNRTK